MTTRPPAITLTMLPVDIEVGDTVVTILEATKLKLPWDEWMISCQIKCGQVASKIFNITYKDNKELRLKLELEVAKFKYALFTLGRERMIEIGLATPIK